MNSSSRLLALLGTSLAAVATLPAQSVLYRETFSSTTNNLQPSQVGWGVHYGSGTAYSNFANNAAGVGNVTGAPTNVSNTANAGSVTTTFNGTGQVASGIFFASATGLSGATPGPAVLAWTNEAGAISVSNVGQISFYLGNTSGAQPVRVAVQVGTQWYVSATTFQNNTLTGAGEFATKATLQTLAFNSAASNWNTVTFQQGGTLTANGTGNLTLGSVASSALSGTINAFGIYLNSGSTANARFDTYTITSIPEPASYAALLGLGSVGLAVMRRRQRV